MDPLSEALAGAGIDDVVTLNHPSHGTMTLAARVDEDGGGILWGAVDGDEDELLTLHMRTKVWVAPMLRDVERNQKYSAAIERVVANLSAGSSGGGTGSAAPGGRLVLDVGTGTGLLAMLACRAGAERVVACEMFEPVATMAKRIIECNRHQWQAHDGDVTVLCTHSTDLHVNPLPPSTPETPPSSSPPSSPPSSLPSSSSSPSPSSPSSTLLPRRADCLVSELLDSTLLAEGLLPTVRDAWSRLLRPGATVLPCGARVYGQVVESLELASLHPDVSKIDLSGGGGGGKRSRGASGGEWSGKGQRPRLVTLARDSAAARCDGTCTVPVRLQSLAGSPFKPTGSIRGGGRGGGGDRALGGGVRCLSEPFEVFEFDLSSPHSLPPARGRSRVVPVAATASGTPHAVVYWWDLVLAKGSPAGGGKRGLNEEDRDQKPSTIGDGGEEGEGEDIVYSTNPFTHSWQDHWLHAAHPCFLPLEVPPVPSAGDGGGGDDGGGDDGDDGGAHHNPPSSTHPAGNGRGSPSLRRGGSVAKGDCFNVEASHDDSAIWFRLQRSSSSARKQASSGHRHKQQQQQQQQQREKQPHENQETTDDRNDEKGREPKEEEEANPAKLRSKVATPSSSSFASSPVGDAADRDGGGFDCRGGDGSGDDDDDSDFSPAKRQKCSGSDGNFLNISENVVPEKKAPSLSSSSPSSSSSSSSLACPQPTPAAVPPPRCSCGVHALFASSACAFPSSAPAPAEAATSPKGCIQCSHPWRLSTTCGAPRLRKWEHGIRAALQSSAGRRRRSSGSGRTSRKGAGRHTTVVDVSEGSYLTLMAARLAERSCGGRKERDDGIDGDDDEEEEEDEPALSSFTCVGLEERALSELVWGQLATSNFNPASTSTSSVSVSVLLARPDQIALVQVKKVPAARSSSSSISDNGGSGHEACQDMEDVLLLFDGHARGLEQRPVSAALHYFHVCAAFVKKNFPEHLLKTAPEQAASSSVPPCPSSSSSSSPSVPSSSSSPSSSWSSLYVAGGPFPLLPSVPARARIMCCAVTATAGSGSEAESQLLRSYGRVGSVCGFDHTPLDTVLDSVLGFNSSSSDDPPSSSTASSSIASSSSSSSSSASSSFSSYLASAPTPGLQLSLCEYDACREVPNTRTHLATLDYRRLLFLGKKPLTAATPTTAADTASAVSTMGEKSSCYTGKTASGDAVGCGSKGGGGGDEDGSGGRKSMRGESVVWVPPGCDAIVFWVEYDLVDDEEEDVNLKVEEGGGGRCGGDRGNDENGKPAARSSTSEDKATKTVTIATGPMVRGHTCSVKLLRQTPPPTAPCPAAVFSSPPPTVSCSFPAAAIANTCTPSTPPLAPLFVSVDLSGGETLFGVGLAP